MNAPNYDSRFTRIEKDIEYMKKDDERKWIAIGENKALTKSIDKKMTLFIGGGFVLQVIILPPVVAWISQRLLHGILP